MPIKPEQAADVLATDSTADDEDLQNAELRSVLAANIAANRQRLRLSRRVLAEKIGVTEGSIGQYERAVRTPNIYQLMAMSDIFGVSVDQLIGHSNNDFEAVEEYRFDRACEIARELKYYVKENSNGSVQVSRKEKKAKYRISNARSMIELNPNELTPIQTFADRRAFTIFVEDVLNCFLSATGAEEVFSHALNYILENSEYEIKIESVTPF